ncbi:MAG TPA: methyl-accepting chemotaxis protein [Syntrophomonadaceae bacterium]|nr:methyl-accepting chemotaxis protein [Syntrophomonadaceae bacterium]
MKNRLVTKIVVYLVSFVTIIFAIFYGINVSVQKKLINEFEQQYSVSILNQAELALDSAYDQSEALVQALEHNPEILKAFANGDRELLGALVTPLFESWEKEYDVSQLQFISPDVHSFYRAHKPEEFGDDLSFRKGLSRVIQTKEPLTVVESGVAGYGLRCIIPVTDGDRFLGACEVGISLNKVVERALGNQNLGYYSLYSLKDNQFEKLWGNDAQVSLLPADLEKLHQGQSFYRTSSDDKYILVMVPIKDADNQTIAYIQGELPRDNILQAEKTAKLQIFLMMILALLILCGSIVIILRRALQHLKPLQEAMNDVSNGDLTRIIELASRQDEIGQVTSDFSKLLDKIRGVFKELFTTTSNLTSNATFMNDVTTSSVAKLNLSINALQELSQQLDDVGKNLQQADLGVEQIAAATQTVAEQAQNMQESYIALTEVARSSKDSLSQIVQSINNLKASSIDTLDNAQELEVISRDIGAISSTIMAVSDQTNLLALNAAIESARAGEHGRGFSVVAEEVRKLAEETAQYAQQISNLITNVQSHITGFVQQIESMARIVDEGNQTTLGVVQKLEEIVNHIETLEKSVYDISSAMEEQSASSQEISAVVNSVTEVSNDLLATLSDTMQHIREQVDNFSELTRIAGETNQISDSLRAIIQQYRLPDEAVLTQVKDDHRSFVRKYEFIVKQKLYFDPDQVVDHHSCRLGKWYAGITDAQIKQVFTEAADEPHKQIHSLARQAVILNNEGRHEEAQQIIAKMHENSSKIIAAIDRIIEHVSK